MEKRYVSKASDVRCNQSTSRHAYAFKGIYLLDERVLSCIEKRLGLVYNCHPSNKYSIIFSTDSHWQFKGVDVLRVRYAVLQKGPCINFN